MGEWGVVKMIIKEQKLILLYSDLKIQVDIVWLEKTMLWYQLWFLDDKPSYHTKKIFMYGKYPCVTLHGKKLHIHRLLMMYKEDRELERNEYVHHIDGNVLNNLGTNLEIMDAFKHQSYHTSRRKLSKEHKRKIGLANKKRKGIKYKKIYENSELLK